MNEVLLLNGTCGSGKSTIGNILGENYGYEYVDADIILKQIKKRHSVQFEYNDDIVFMEYGLNINHCWEKEKSTVISSVFTFEDLTRFNKMLDGKYKNRVVVLIPEVEIAIKRTQERSCFASVIPEYWVRKFHQDMQNIYDNNQQIEFIDNSLLSIEETVSKVLENKDKISAPRPPGVRCGDGL
jgi:shikimate kinase